MMKKIIILILVGLAFFTAFLCWLLLTTKGAHVAIDHVFERVADSQQIEYQGLSGNLSEGVLLQNIELNHLKGFPKGTSAKIQSLFFKVSAFDFLYGITVRIDNARLFLPGSDPILLFGSFSEGIFDFNLYSRGFYLNELSGYFQDIQRSGFSGLVQEADIYIKGTLDELRLEGGFVINDVAYQNIFLRDCPVEIDLAFKSPLLGIRPFGSLRVKSGSVQAPRSTVNISNSRISFAGDFENPEFDILGYSMVEGVRIKIVLKGNPQNPDLKLSSHPSFSEQQLMIMLATGKRWKELEASLAQGQASENLTKEFVDFFLFAQGSQNLANYFGISEFIVTYEQDKKGLEVRKDLTDRWRVGYGLFQQTQPEFDPAISQKFLGEFKFIEGGFVGVEKRFTGQGHEGEAHHSSRDHQVDGRIYFKYKKDF